MRNIYLVATILFIAASVAVARPLTGKLVQTETGEATVSTALTNGASFKIGDATYRLELEQTADERLVAELSQEGLPTRMQDLPASEAFTMLTHMSGATIVCAREVEKDLEISINTQDDSIMSVIEQVCFQIGAKATVEKGTVWITSK